MKKHPLNHQSSSIISIHQSAKNIKTFWQVKWRAFTSYCDKCHQRKRKQRWLMLPTDVLYACVPPLMGKDLGSILSTLHKVIANRVPHPTTHCNLNMRPLRSFVRRVRADFAKNKLDLLFHAILSNFLNWLELVVQSVSINWYWINNVTLIKLNISKSLVKQVNSIQTVFNSFQHWKVLYFIFGFKQLPSLFGYFPNRVNRVE